MSNWSQVGQFQPTIHELLLLESFKYLHHQMLDLKEMLAEREQSLHQSSTDPPAATAATKPAANGSSVGSSGSFSMTASQFASKIRSATEPSAAEVDAHRRRARHVSELMTRALVAEEMQRFRYEIETRVEHPIDPQQTDCEWL